MKITVTALLAFCVLAFGLMGCGRTPDNPLPQAMKGYELYSWQEKDGWHFTLITGTNRIKTLEEIISGSGNLAENGLVLLHAVGMHEVKDLLARIPSGESVFWSDGHFVTGQQNAAVELSLPPEDTISDIRDFMDGRGVNFSVY